MQLSLLADGGLSPLNLALARLPTLQSSSRALHIRDIWRTSSRSLSEDSFLETKPATQ